MIFQDLTNHEGIERALQSWLLKYGGLQAVQWLNLPLGRPPKPYGTLQIISPGHLEGQDSEVQRYNATTERIDVGLYGFRRFTVQTCVYSEAPDGPGQEHAVRRLERAVSALRLPAAQDALAAEGLAFQQVLSPPTRADEQLGDRWEWRAMADLEFAYTSLVAEKSEGTAPNADGGYNWIETIENPAVTLEE